MNNEFTFMVNNVYISFSTSPYFKVKDAHSGALLHSTKNMGHQGQQADKNVAWIVQILYIQSFTFWILRFNLMIFHCSIRMCIF